MSEARGGTGERVARLRKRDHSHIRGIRSPPTGSLIPSVCNARYPVAIMLKRIWRTILDRIRRAGGEEVVLLVLIGVLAGALWVFVELAGEV